MQLILLSIGFGLVTASILAMGSVGFTLQFGVTNLFNLAFGETMTLGMFAGYFVHDVAGQSMWLAFAAGGALAAVASFLIGRFVYLPFIQRGTAQFAMVMVTVAVSIVIKNGVQFFTSANFYSYQLPPQESVTLLGMVFSPRQLAIIALSVACMLGLHLLFRYTRLGKAMRATSDDSALARSCGIPTRNVVSVAWLLSGMLAGLAGCALAMDLGTFDANTGSTFLLVIVSAAVFGSVGEPYGAMVGALVIGVASELAATIDPALKYVVAFGILIVVLLVRPEGLRSGRAQTKLEVAA